MGVLITPHIMGVRLHPIWCYSTPFLYCCQYSPGVLACTLAWDQPPGVVLAHKIWGHWSTPSILSNHASLPLEVGPFKSIYEVRESTVSSSTLLHFRLK